ncbi:hypothetical protein V8F20_005385 [Naviculisporaceae sp. PSN 640]
MLEWHSWYKPACQHPGCHHPTKERVTLPSSFPAINSRSSDKYFCTLPTKFRNTMDFKCAMALANTSAYSTQPPRSILDPAKQTDERLKLDYTSPNPGLIYLHEHVARNREILNHFTTQIGNLIPDMEEPKFAVSRVWGGENSVSGDDGWTTVCVYRSVREVLALLSNRIFVGSPLNRTQEIIDVGMRYAVDLLLFWLLSDVFGIPLFPRSAGFGLSLSAWDQEHGEAGRSDSHSDIKKKIPTFEPEPNDAIQWCLKTAKPSGGPFMWKPRTIADRILIMNFASMTPFTLPPKPSLRCWLIRDIRSRSILTNSGRT